MFSLFPADGNTISIWTISNETYFRWMIQILHPFFNFRILHISCEVPYFTPYLTALNVNCSSKFILSKYLLLLVSSSRHDFLLNEKKIIQQQKIQINFSHISQYYMMNLYSKRSCIDKKPIFHCTRSLWVHPSHAIFFMILLPHDFNFWHLIIF